MAKHNEEDLLAKRNQLEAELEQVKETLGYIEQERRQLQIASVIKMVRDNPNIWDKRLVTCIENIGEYSHEDYKVTLWIDYSPLDND